MRAPPRFTCSLASLLLVLATGCAAEPTVERLDAPGDARGLPLERADWPRPARVGVPFYEGAYPELHHQVVVRLARAVDHVQLDHQRGAGLPVDYIVDLDWRIEGHAVWTNFLECFPGFALFMPTWLPLRWEYDVVAIARLVRPLDGGMIAERRRTARFEGQHTPVGHEVACDLGWGAILFPPMLLSPFVSAVVSVARPWPEPAFARVLARSPDGRDLAREVAADLLGAIDDDLRRGGGAPPLPDLGVDEGE